MYKFSTFNNYCFFPRFSDFGTMLEIRDIQYFPDGRAVVDTVGSRRFKVRIFCSKHFFKNVGNNVSFVNSDQVGQKSYLAAYN